jgi:hypothetical protein
MRCSEDTKTSRAVLWTRKAAVDKRLGRGRGRVTDVCPSVEDVDGLNQNSKDLKRGRLSSWMRSKVNISTEAMEMHNGKRHVTDVYADA